MTQLPAAITTYLYNFIANYHSPAYLLIDRSGVLLDCGGDLARYGLQGLQIGSAALEQLAFLEGLLPLAEAPLFLPFMKHEQNPSANVHVFAEAQGDWVLFLDAEDEENQRHSIQKPGNFFSLMCQKQLRLSVQDRHQETSEDNRLNNQQYAVLCAHVSFDTLEKKAQSAQVTSILDSYLGVAGEAICSESGVISAWLGNIFVATFGLWPTKKVPQQHAFEAGLRILERISSLKEPPLSQSHSSWGVGMMIRSEVSFSHGPNANLSHMMLKVLAQQMSVLMQWVTDAAPYEILIDAHTFEKMGNGQDLFVPSPLVFQNEQGQYYSYRFQR